jgi:hypothetical protein
MRHLFFLFLSCFYLPALGQTYQSLLKLVSTRHGTVFTFSKPITSVKLEQSELKHYSHDYLEDNNKKLDNVMFLQIITNCKIIDTSRWLENEMTNVLLVDNRDDVVSKKYAIEKLALTGKTQIKHLKKQVNNFNSTANHDRDIYYFSRPVFDDTKKFAVVQWDNGHSYLGGGGGIILFQLVDTIWKESGIIKRWNY